MSQKPGRRAGIRHLLYRLVFTGRLRAKPCAHLHLIQVVEPATHVCADCVTLGDTWPALRMCMVCGYIGCCNDAQNQHALKHYQATGHPIMRSIERGDDWMWCYVDKALLPLPTP